MTFILAVTTARGQSIRIPAAAKGVYLHDAAPIDLHQNDFVFYSHPEAIFAGIKYRVYGMILTVPDGAIFARKKDGIYVGTDYF